MYCKLSCTILYVYNKDIEIPLQLNHMKANAANFLIDQPNLLGSYIQKVNSLVY
jgi:hypothetical protein